MSGMGWAGWVLAIGALVLPECALFGQDVRSAATSAARPAAGIAGRNDDPVVATIEDRATGGRWLLSRDAAHLAGPGKLVREDRGETGSRTPNLGTPDSGMPASVMPAVGRQPVIRAGEHIWVEEHSERADARLQAVALTPAGEGAWLRVRLLIGGRIFRALAAGPGRAVLSAEASQ